HLGLEHAAGRQAEENIRALHDVGERALAGVAGETRDRRIETRTIGIKNTILVGDENVFVLHAECDQHVEAGDAGGTGAAGGELHVADVLAEYEQGVEHGGADDDRGAVLIIVEYRNAHARAQLALDFETLRRLDVFEIDAAERGLEAGDDVDEFVGIVLVDLEIEHVDAGEFLE